MGRGPTAYFLFSDENRASAKAELEAAGSKLGVAQVAKLVGQRWGALSDEEKQKYKERAAALQGEGCLVDGVGVGGSARGYGSVPCMCGMQAVRACPACSLQSRQSPSCVRPLVSNCSGSSGGGSRGHSRAAAAKPWRRWRRRRRRCSGGRQGSAAAAAVWPAHRLCQAHHHA